MMNASPPRDRTSRPIELPLMTAQRRNVQRGVWITLAILIGVLIFNVYAVVTRPQWQQFVLLAITIVAVLFIIAAWRLYKRERLVQATTLLISAPLLCSFAASVFVNGLGLGPALACVCLTLILAESTLPAPAANRWIVAGLFAGALALILELIQPAWRSNFDFPSFAPVLAAVLLAVLGTYMLRRFRTYALRGKLIIAFLAVSLISIAGVAIYADLAIRQSVEDQATSQLAAIAQLQATTVSDLLVKEAELLQTLALNKLIQDQVTSIDTRYSGSPAEIQAALLAKDQAWRVAVQADNNDLPLIVSMLDNPIASDLREYRTTYPENVEVFVTDRYGALVAATNRTSDYYQADEDWWQQAYNNGRGAIFIGQPEYDESSATYASVIGLPLYAHGTRYLVGVMRTTFQLAQIADVLSAARVGQTGQVDLLLPNNTFLHSTAAITAPASFLAALSTSTGPIVEADLDTTPSLAAIAPIRSTDTDEGPSIARLNWRIVTHQSRAEISAPVDAHAKSVLIVSVLIAGLMAGAALGTAQVLAGPITRLTTVAAKVKGGDLSAQAAIETNDEIGALAAAFNSMTAQLRGLISSLEERVKARTEQVRASADVGRAASSILDVNQLVRQAVSLITERFGFYYAAVFTLDAAGEYAVLRDATGEAGRILKERGHRLAVDNKSMVGATILTRRARIALDVGKEAIRFANPLLPNTRSEIALPLIAGQRVIGALDVQSEQSAAFDDTSAEVLQTMADQIAVALQNAELFDRSEQQARTLTVLNKMSRELALATTFERIAHITAQTVTQLVGTSHIILAFKSANPELLSVHHVFPDRGAALGEAQTMPATSTLAGHALNTGQTVHAPNLADDAAQYPDAAVLSRIGMRSMVSVPLRVGDHILGALNVGHSQSTPLTNEQVAELEQVASQMAVALENFNLVEQTRRALSELDAANRRLIGQAWEVYTQSTGKISAEWRDGLWTKDEGGRIEADHRDLVSKPYSPNSNLQLPIKVRGQTIGEFDIMSGGAPRDWLADDIAFAEALIDQVGQMIENARLLEETERLARRERTINEINSRVRQTIDPDAILKTAVNELGQSLKAARVVARIGVEANGGDMSGPEKSSERTMGE